MSRRGIDEQRRRDLVASLTGDILEIGAGSGVNVRRYRAATSVTLLEPSRFWSRVAASYAAESPIPASAVRAPAESIPLPDGSVDHVVAVTVLCSVRDPQAVLAEIRRVLRPGGTFEFIEHVRGEGRLATWQDRLTPLQRLISSGCHLNRDVPRELSLAGFRIAATDRFSMKGVSPLMRPAVTGRAVRELEPVDCAWCGTEFTPTQSGQKFCKPLHKKKGARAPGALTASRQRRRHRLHLEKIDPDGTRREVCKRKALFGSEDDAQREAARLNAENGTALVAYECPFCYWWHLMTDRSAGAVKWSA